MQKYVDIIYKVTHVKHMYLYLHAYTCICYQYLHVYVYVCIHIYNIYVQPISICTYMYGYRE